MTKIYRVMLLTNHNMNVIYPIGCQTTYTGFWTSDLNIATRIFNYIKESYFIDGFEKIDNIIVETTLDNVKIKKDFQEHKHYHNEFFDKNELFITHILDYNKLKIKN